MSSPFALTSSRGSLFANKKAVDTSPPEDVVLVASKSQVITAIIPYGTKKSQAIRAFMHANVVSTDDSTKGARFFIYRQVNGWSTIHLESTEAVPKLTGDPITVLKTAWREFTANCADVGNVKIKWEGSNEIMGYDDIDGMEGLFDPLPDSTNANPSTGPAKTDGEMIYELEEKIYTKVTAVEANVDTIARRLAHVVDSLDNIYTAVVSIDPSLPSGSKDVPVTLTADDDDVAVDNGGKDKTISSVTATPTTKPSRKAAGKRRASEIH